MADVATLQAYRDEAVVARHKLAMGESIAEIWRDGRRMTFRAMNLESLDDYIKTLDREIAEAQAVASGRSRRGPISVGWIG